MHVKSPRGGRFFFSIDISNQQPRPQSVTSRNPAAGARAERQPSKRSPAQRTRALMDAIYEAGIPADEERDFDFVMMTIEAAAEAA